MNVLTTQDVIRTLARIAPEVKVQFFETSTATSDDAAQSIGCELGQIVKSLLFIVNDQPVVVLASGDQKIDDRKLAALFEVGRKKIKIATYEQCIEIVGYPPGGVPPVGHRTEDLPVIVDDSLSRFDQLYAAAGESNSIFPITLEQLVQISNGQIAIVVKD